MKNIFTAILAIALLFSNMATAQKSKKEFYGPNLPWPNEPTSFFGIKLGAPLADSMSKCVKVGYSRYGTSRCWWQLSAGENLQAFVIENSPRIGEHWVGNVFVSVVDNLVEQMSITVSANNSSELATILLDKFGTPHKMETETKQNRMGAKFESTKMTWVGVTYKLTYETIDGKIDEGSIHISSKKFDTALENKFKASAAKGKDAL